MDGWQSGLMHLFAKQAIPDTGSRGSNPLLSVMLKPPVVEEVVKEIRYERKWFRKVPVVHYHCYHQVDRYTDETARVYVRGCCECGRLQRCQATSTKHGPHIQLRTEDLDGYTEWEWWSPYASWY